jgi:ElaB/YqjD/DUF883 family membrane-anchored ribosome-binding protein
MTMPDSTSTPEPEKGASVSELEADIERTRSELGDTVEHLADKLDVKARAKHRIEETKADVADHVEEVKGQVAAVAHRTKDALTDDGRPNQKGWFAAAVAVAIVGALVITLIRRGR